jgi:hypothetical protein
LTWVRRVQDAIVIARAVDKAAVRKVFRAAQDELELDVHETSCRNHLCVIHAPDAGEGVDLPVVDVDAILLKIRAVGQDAPSLTAHRDYTAVPRNVEHLELGLVKTIRPLARGAAEDVLGVAIRHCEERSVLIEETP